MLHSVTLGQGFYFYVESIIEDWEDWAWQSHILQYGMGTVYKEFYKKLKLES